MVKGVYIFESTAGHTYVGSSINLFVRVTSYFYNSILKSGTRAVLVHFFNMAFPTYQGIPFSLRNSIFISDITTANLIQVFDSKTFAMMHMHIDYRTLNDCLTNGTLYLGRFMLSLEVIPEMHYSSEFLLTITEFGDLLNSVRDTYKVQAQSTRKSFTAFNVKNPSSPLCGSYNSINEFARLVKVDRSSIRSFVNGEKPVGSLYKNTWLLTPIKI